MRGFKHGIIIFEWCENGYEIEPDEDVFNGIWSEYERVIVGSMISSFGLDLFIEDEDALNGCLISAYKFFDIKIPWEGDFDSFMGNSSNGLVFE